MKYLIILLVIVFFLGCSSSPRKYYFDGCNITKFKKTDTRAYWFCWRG